MFESRKKRVVQIFKNYKIDALFVSNPFNIFYLTGLAQFMHPGDAYLIITSEQTYLVTNVLYADGVPKSDLYVTCILTQGNPLKNQLEKIVKQDKVTKIGVEGEVSVALYDHLSKTLGKKPVVTTGIVERVRIFKDSGEIAKIKKACALTDLAYTYVVKNLKQGTSERELAFKLEIFIREKGGALAFPTIAAFGVHAATPHHDNSDTKLSKKSEAVLLDFGAKIDGYTSDITRTIFVDTPSDTVASTYDTLLEIQEKTINFAQKQKIGNNLAKIAKYAGSLFDKASLPPLPHLLGHGLGIEVHEEPRVGVLSTDKLLSGMVFTIEPGIYVPGHLGIRIEDTVGMCEKALQIFTKAPKKRVVISI